MNAEVAKVMAELDVENEKMRLYYDISRFDTDYLTNAVAFVDDGLSTMMKSSH